MKKSRSFPVWRHSCATQYHLRLSSPHARTFASLSISPHVAVKRSFARKTEAQKIRKFQLPAEFFADLALRSIIAWERTRAHILTSLLCVCYLYRTLCGCTKDVRRRHCVLCQYLEQEWRVDQYKTSCANSDQTLSTDGEAQL